MPFAPVQIILMELFMDLAASATFVAEPPEGDLMQQPPRDPQSALHGPADGLEHSSPAPPACSPPSSVAYLSTWYGTRDVTQAQTVAFFTWMLGHVFLAINMRSERQPLWRLGLFGNRLMVLWAAATLAFVLITSSVPAVGQLFRTTALGSAQWLVVIGSALLGTFWMEWRKWAGE